MSTPIRRSRHAQDARDRRDVAGNIEIEVRVEKRVGCDRQARHEQRITIRCPSRDHLKSDATAGARSVLDDELLTQPL